MAGVRKGALKHKSDDKLSESKVHVDPLGGSPIRESLSKLAKTDDKADMDVSASGPEGFVRAGLLVGAGAGVGSGGGVSSSDGGVGVSDGAGGTAEERKDEEKEEKGKEEVSGSKGDLPGVPPWPSSVSGQDQFPGVPPGFGKGASSLYTVPYGPFQGYPSAGQLSLENVLAEIRDTNQNNDHKFANMQIQLGG